MRFDIYCDESQPDVFWSKSDTRARFLLIGGIWLPSDQRSTIKSAIGALKARHGLNHEIKWHKVHVAKMDFYRALVDLFIDSDLRFRCIAVEGDKVDMVRFHQDDQELGFYKFYYQVIKHWLDDFNEYQIFCDEKTSRSRDRLAILRRTLDYANLTSTVRAVQALPSKEVVLLQLTDFLLGMASSRLNRTAQRGSAKDEVIQHLEKRLGRAVAPTWKSEQKFNVFRINLQGGW